MNAGLQCRISFAVLADFTNRIYRIPMDIVLKCICRLIGVQQFCIPIVFVSMFLYHFVALEKYYQTILKTKLSNHWHRFFFWMGNFKIDTFCALVIEMTYISAYRSIFLWYVHTQICSSWKALPNHVIIDLLSYTFVL